MKIINNTITFSLVLLILSLITSNIPVSYAQQYGCCSPDISKEIQQARADDFIFYMKTNSIAEIYANFTFDSNSNNNQEISSGISYYPSGSHPNLSVDPRIILLSMQPNTLENHRTTPITYTITASNSSEGTYLLNLGGFCDNYYLLVVGLNKSEVDPKIFTEFMSPHVEMGCGPFFGLGVDMKLVGFSGITFGTSNSTVPEFPLALVVLVTSISLIILMSAKTRLRF